MMDEDCSYYLLLFALITNVILSTHGTELVYQVSLGIYYFYIFPPGIHFMVSMTYDASFVDKEIIKFDKIITNVGGGYICDNGNADYGKFIAPQNRTYQFNANLYSRDNLIGMDLVKNGMLIIGAHNGGAGPASLSAILDLTEGDQVYLQQPHWVAVGTLYNRYFTSFSGVLIRADN